MAVKFPVGDEVPELIGDGTLETVVSIVVGIKDDNVAVMSSELLKWY